MRHSNGCISELVPLTAAVARTRRSLDERLRDSAPEVGTTPIDVISCRLANQTARSRPLPKIIITSTSSSNEEWKDATRETLIEDVRQKKLFSSADTVDVVGNGCRKSSALSDSGDELAADKQRSSLISLKLTKLHIISQLRSLNKEKRAAKTVGVIIGCFILCWAPFFTVYLVGAFCSGCTPTRLFHLFFWLGYANSAINPFIYALCSKEFRYAFKKLLRCRVEQRPRRNQAFERQPNAPPFLGRLQSFRIQIASRHEDSVDDDMMMRPLNE